MFPGKPEKGCHGIFCSLAPPPSGLAVSTVTFPDGSYLYDFIRKKNTIWINRTNQDDKEVKWISKCYFIFYISHWCYPIMTESKKENIIFGMLCVSHNKAESELNVSYLLTIFKDASYREMASQQMKWKQQYKHVLYISKWKSVYPTSYCKIPSDFLVKKETHPDPTTGLSPPQHLKSKINLKYMRNADFIERIIVN